MDGADRIWLRQDQKVVVALEVVVPSLEALAAEIGFRKLPVLDFGAHRAVENKDALLRRCCQGGADFCAIGMVVLGHVTLLSAPFPTSGSGATMPQRPSRAVRP